MTHAEDIIAFFRSGAFCKEFGHVFEAVTTSFDTSGGITYNRHKCKYCGIEIEWGNLTRKWQYCITGAPYP